MVSEKIWVFTARRKGGYMNKLLFCVLLSLLFSQSITADIDIPDIEVNSAVEETISKSADEPTKTLISLGVCKLSAYCKENYPHICNDGDSSTTATGTTPTAGRTIAVDPKVIPYGSEVIVNGHTYIAEDCGGAIKGNRVDILFDTHQEALSFGIQYAEVSYIVKGE